MLKKRGVQPIIATVLLVGFAVVVTATIAMFGTDFVKDLQQKQGNKAQLELDCNSVGFDIKSVSASEIIIQNTKTRTIEAFSIIYHGDTSKREDHFDLTIKSGAQGSITTQPVGGGVGKVKKVDIIPKIRSHNPPPIWKSCPNKKTVKV